MCITSSQGSFLPRPMAFLTELATNASEHNVGVLIFSGNDDSLVSHRSSEGKIFKSAIGKCELICCLSCNTSG